MCTCLGKTLGNRLPKVWGWGSTSLCPSPETALEVSGAGVAARRARGSYESQCSQKNTGFSHLARAHCAPISRCRGNERGVYLVSNSLVMLLRVVLMTSSCVIKGKSVSMT